MGRMPCRQIQGLLSYLSLLEREIKLMSVFIGERWYN